MKSILLNSLKGISQIMLQENPFAGFLIILGVFWGSITMGIAVVLAVFCGTASAILLKYNKEEIEKGLYGFNAALVGAATLLFFKPLIITWIIVLLGAVLSTLIQHFFIKRKITVYTLPFVLTAWIILALGFIFNENLFQSADINSITANKIDFINTILKSHGQIIFQNNAISGILFILAILISSPIASFYGILASLFSIFTIFIFSTHIQDVNIGLCGFNAVLCAIAFAGNKKTNIISGLSAVILSIIISFFIQEFTSIPQLTFPFVLASVVVFYVGKFYQNAASTRLKKT